MPEFAGPDAGLFDPSNPENMAQCLKKMLLIPKEQLCESGKSFARSFSWENTAAKALNAIQSLIQSPQKTLKSCCLIRLWPILQPSDNSLVLETIKQLKNEFKVQHFVSESEIYFSTEVANQAAIHPVETLANYLREDPAMVLICWPRSQDELELIKGFECEEKHIVIDDVNKKLFCSGSNFDNRNKLADENLRNFKEVLEISSTHKSLGITKLHYDNN
jgi:hypothetical protein